MESEQSLHVVAFNIPYPPNYGGVIDIFYKLEALKKAGVSVILHAFSYGREPSERLESLCREVNYYERKRGLKYFFSSLPYIVATRQSGILRDRLLADEHPVMLEGLHCTHLLKELSDRGKKVFVRTHNIEHNYYRMLARSERNLFKKIFFSSESRKLKRHEPALSRANALFAISTTDANYFHLNYGNTTHISAFHQHTSVNSTEGLGSHILFHGNLSVPENEKALVYLVRRVLSKVNHPVIIAGKDPSSFTRKLVGRYSNITLVANPPDEEMNRLVQEAHINLLYTYQPTGLKLKLLHSLHTGKYCMANPLMLSGSGLDALCVIYRNTREAVDLINQLMDTPFPPEEVVRRRKLLSDFSNAGNARKMLDQF